MLDILDSPIEYLKGVGPKKGELLRKELGIATFADLLLAYPSRYIDKTQFHRIAELTEDSGNVQLKGVLRRFSTEGEGRKTRLVGQFRDESGVISLVWFTGISWLQKQLVIGQEYVIYGRVNAFMDSFSIPHPEMEVVSPENTQTATAFAPVYPSTEKLKAKFLSGQVLAKFTKELLTKLSQKDLSENLPETLLKTYKLVSRYSAYRQIHFPANEEEYRQALRRLKFEELFFAQLRLGQIRLQRLRFSRGQVFDKVGNLFHEFYSHHLPFELTNAQKKVLKEIRKDTAGGKQMNRLLQGDVGSGKTMIALLSMLLAADNHFQSVLMAPTEILAQQHFESIKSYLGPLPVQLELLTGSTSAANRKKIVKACESGQVQMLIGTHAVIETKVKFQNLGLAIVDEQHKFGVEQRAKLWEKSTVPPHILVMTATPIPRTLALTAYGDLDYSILDELPPGRMPITTYHRNERARPQVMDFIRKEIAKGRQVYVIYPLIEESSKLDYENLMKGFEEVKAFFPEPKYWISMVHGKQPPVQKETNMQRFVMGETQIMVATTVVEVGVNVPNATVMIIESAERFGLSQLHQLRGRVGRGAEKSYCILLTGQKLGNDARERMQIMEATRDGFLIAEKDLELRGPGQIDGTRQSGALDFKLASIVNDKEMLEVARNAVEAILETDPDLTKSEHERLKNFLQQQKSKTRWSKVG